MELIRELFDPSKPIDRRIEKVITYGITSEDLLKREITEYVATENIERHFEDLLDRIDHGMVGDAVSEVGVWVSGFYGSGKSSFTKYLGFALDPNRAIEGRPFREWLADQFKSKTLRARLTAVAQKHPSAVVMLDLAAEALAGATMAEISTVLYAKVMQWAGYSHEEKVAYLEFMLEQDGRRTEFERRFKEEARGQPWDSAKNQMLVVKSVASRLAVEFYPHVFPDAKAFNDIKLEERIKEDDRVRQMIDLVQRKTGHQSIIFILDEVGQYVAARDDLILNLDGLAKNLKNLGRGKVWIIATAQQTLTEDNPRATTNSAKLFKLKDRFPVSIDLEASDIKEICYTRLLSKSSKAVDQLNSLFDAFGPQLRVATDLKNAAYYRSELTKEVFCRYYPFLPHHFDILLQLLARLARSRGGIGLRSAIKVIQDILVDPSQTRKGMSLLASDKVGRLATAVHIFDTLQADIARPFPHIVNGVEKAAKVFGEGSIHTCAAKSIGVLQILEDFPVTRENVASIMHSSTEAPPASDTVSLSIDEMLGDKSVPLAEIDGFLRFMSEAVLDLENQRQRVTPRSADVKNVLHTSLREIFTPTPTVKLKGVRAVSTGLRVVTAGRLTSLTDDRDAVQTNIEFVGDTEYERAKNERIIESSQRSSSNTIFLLGHQDANAEDLATEICRCQEICRLQKDHAADGEVAEYLRAQEQRADNLKTDLTRKLKSSLSGGSFLFRGKPRSVAELAPDVTDALRAQLATAAEEVFNKYGEAPVSAESGTAEQFLKTDHLDKISDKYDPLGLVKGGGVAGINTNHHAIISIRDFLEQHGRVDGRKLLDDLYAAPYGWSKDTTRYLVAAMLVAGLIQLRVSGEDVTVRGDVAIGKLKNTSEFNKILIALRDSPTTREVLLRASERMQQLTGAEILPLEEDISRNVIKHFPDLQQDYAPLAAQLKNLALPGDERADNIKDNISEILKGDASDAANRLGQEICPLFNDLRWAREVRKAFDGGVEDDVSRAKRLLSAIPELPDSGAPGQLRTETESARSQLSEHLKREDFYDHIPEIRNLTSAVDARVRESAEKLGAELAEDLGRKTSRLQSAPDWGKLGTADKVRLGAELDRLKITVAPHIDGLRRLLTQQYQINRELERVEKEIRTLAQVTPPLPGTKDIVDVTLQAPREFGSPEELNAFIATLQQISESLATGAKVRIRWVD